jgi:signal recognition particle GTPase
MTENSSILKIVKEDILIILGERKEEVSFNKLYERIISMGIFPGK